MKRLIERASYWLHATFGDATVALIVVVAVFIALAIFFYF